MIAFGSVVRRIEKLAIAALLLACLNVVGESPLPLQAKSPDNHTLELVRAARSWEFACAVGDRSALLGDESGTFEAWVYPLKILRNFHLRFKVNNEVIEGKSLVRSVRVRPESATITYVWDTFSVKETLLAPIHEPGIIIQLEIDTTQPLEIQTAFERDFQLEWPGAMGGSDIEWNPTLHAFFLDENQRRFSALIGSPSATESHVELSTNYITTKENALGLGIVPPGKATKLIVIAASFQGLPPVDVTYKRLSISYPQLLAESAAYYQTYLNSTVQLELPDKSLEQAYKWAQISVLQGLVTNPYLGTGLIAGYKTSGEDDQRPGYAWFFGRDALWTSLALNAEGDFSTTRTALEFLSKYQRTDGKVPHEIAQGASFVPWFEKMPYAFASADATPLYIVAMEDYVRHSGDTAFAQEKWDNLWRAYQFIVSTYDTNSVPKNDGVGHGWVEGGPLLPIKNELYQASVALEALRSLADLAHRLGKEDQSAKLVAEFERGKLSLNKAFWMADIGRYAFALDNKDRQVDTLSVLSAVPMWFGLLDESKAQSTIGQLAKPEIQTDWGMRIIPANHPKYDAAGYHSGTVWPLFTGWASVGEYRYHQALPAYANLRSNALLSFDGSLGHVAEVLSGSYYQTLATGSPHQIWSSAMVISPLLKGMLGLDAEALTNHLSFNPHIPADWTTFAIQHVQAGSCVLNLRYNKTVDNQSSERLTLDIERTSGATCTLDFLPALSLRAQVIGAELNGHKTPFQVQANALDQHVKVHMDASDRSASLVIKLRNDFGLSQHFDLPNLGSANQGLRIVSETWNANRDTLAVDTASASSGTYELSAWNPDQITSVEGAEILHSDRLNTHSATLRITTHPDQTDGSSHQQIVLHFSAQTRNKKQNNQ